jgi:hypothetical protein
MAATAPRYASLLNQANTQVTGDAVAWGGGDGVIECFASNFNGCSVTIQGLAQDGATWIPLDAVNLVFTANKRMGFSFPPGFIRAVVTVANPTALSVNAGVLVH